MTNKPNDGGPAFPVMAGGALHDGASLRDYFAAKAMQGIMARSAGALWNSKNASEVAKSAYSQADAMLAARDNQQISPGHNAALENQIELTKKLNDTRAALVNLIDAQKPVSNTAFNLGQDSKQWKLINSHIDALDAAVNAAREVMK